MLKQNKLSFSKGNAKLGGHIGIFNLPAGFTCPAALLCFSKANQLTGKITDGQHAKFRCYAASAENLFSNIRKSRWHNLTLLKSAGTVQNMAALIIYSLPKKNVPVVRVHSSGDFFSQTYFDAWLTVAKAFPAVAFYAYSKALPFWVARLGAIPANFKLTASYGGKFDSLIAEHGLRSVKVVFSEKEAKDLNLPIDHTDELAYKTDGDFALLIHNTQPAGSEASRAMYALRYRKDGGATGGYKADYFAHYRRVNELQTKGK